MVLLASSVSPVITMVGVLWSASLNIIHVSAQAPPSCTVSPSSIVLGEEPVLTLTYSSPVDIGGWNVLDADGAQVVVTEPLGGTTNELKEDRSAERPGTVMPLRMVYGFPDTGVFSIVDRFGQAGACEITVTSSSFDTKDLASSSTRNALMSILGLVAVAARLV